LPTIILSAKVLGQITTRPFNMKQKQGDNKMKINTLTKSLLLGQTLGLVCSIGSTTISHASNAYEQMLAREQVQYRRWSGLPPLQAPPPVVQQQAPPVRQVVEPVIPVKKVVQQQAPPPVVRRVVDPVVPVKKVIQVVKEDENVENGAQEDAKMKKNEQPLTINAVRSDPIPVPKKVEKKTPPKKTTVLRKKEASESKKRVNFSVPLGSVNAKKGTDSDGDSKRKSVTPRTRSNLNVLVNIHDGLDDIAKLQEQIEVR